MTIHDQQQSSTAMRSHSGAAIPPSEPENVSLAPLICPACHGENPPDAVFCEGCHKALGDFRYVREELRAEAQWHETLAERVTGFIGRPHFLVAHSVWLVIWIVINTGLVAFIHRFDPSPFGLLGILLAAEAIFISGFVLISQNRQNAHANKRAELDYEVSVQTYRAIHVLQATLQQLNARIERIEATIHEER